MNLQSLSLEAVNWVLSASSANLASIDNIQTTVQTTAPSEGSGFLTIIIAALVGTLMGGFVTYKLLFQFLTRRYASHDMKLMQKKAHQKSTTQPSTNQINQKNLQTKEETLPIMEKAKQLAPSKDSAFGKKKFKLLDESVPLADNYFEGWNKFTSAVGGSLEYLTRHKELSKERWDYILKRYNEFVETRNDKSQAISKLQLAQALDPIHELAQTARIANELREVVIVRREMPSRSQLKDWKQEMERLRVRYLRHVSTIYQTPIKQTHSHTELTV